MRKTAAFKELPARIEERASRRPPREKTFARHRGLFATGALLATTVMMLGGLSGCSTVADSGQKIQLKQDAVVYIGREKGVAKKQGEVFDSLGQPTLIESPGHASLYILPTPAGEGQLEADLKPLAAWADDESRAHVNVLLSQLVPKLNDIQGLLASGKNREAVQAVEELKAAYPALSYLNFLHASCLMLAGDKAKARLVLETALKDYPDNQDGRELYRLLHGDEHSLPPESRTGTSKAPAEVMHASAGTTSAPQAAATNVPVNAASLKAGVGHEGKPSTGEK